MKIKSHLRHIYILAFLWIAPGLISPPGLPAINPPPGINPDANTAKQYENYLVIKYLLNSNQLEKAETLIDQYLTAYPQDPFILTEKAYILSEVKGKYEEALEFLKKAKLVYPGYYYANYLQGFILFTLSETTLETDVNPDAIKKEQEFLAEAKKYLEISIEDNPDFYDAYYLLGVVSNAMGEYRESNRYFEESNRFNKTATSYLYMASNYRLLKDTEGAVKIYKEILSFSPDNFRALSALSEIFLEQKDYKTASDYLGKLYQKYPANKKITFQYLYSLIAIGHTKTFMDIANKVDLSESPILLYTKALILFERKKYREAKEILETVKSKDARSSLLLAEIHAQQNNYYRAYLTLENVPAKERDHLYYSVKLHTLSLLNLNRQIVNHFDLLRGDNTLMENLTADDFYTFLFACVNLQLLEKAREAAQLAKDHLKDRPELFADLIPALLEFSPGKEIKGKKPTYELNLFLIEAIYKKHKQYQSAISILNRLIERNNLNQEAYLELCEIYLEQQQLAKSQQLIEKLIKRFPRSPQVKNYYAYFLAQQNKNLEYALELSAFAISKDKENPAYLDTYGYILFRLGRLPEAGQYLEKAYQKHPFEKEIMAHLIDYYRAQKQNHRQQILDIYKKAIDHGVDFKEELIKKTEILKND